MIISALEIRKKLQKLLLFEKKSDSNAEGYEACKVSEVWTRCLIQFFVHNIKSNL